MKKYAKFVMPALLVLAFLFTAGCRYHNSYGGGRGHGGWGGWGGGGHHGHR